MIFTEFKSYRKALVRKVKKPIPHSTASTKLMLANVRAFFG
jgi:hypothetical protein